VAGDPDSPIARQTQLAANVPFAAAGEKPEDSQKAEHTESGAGSESVLAFVQPAHAGKYYVSFRQLQTGRGTR
jgi:hypothetical protein